MGNDIKRSLTRGKTWWRALYMLLFAVFYTVAELVLVAVVLFQFLLLLFTGRTNERLLAFGGGISTYIYQVLCFLTFNTELHPYPFSAWPEPEDEEAMVEEVGEEEEVFEEVAIGETKAEREAKGEEQVQAEKTAKEQKPE